MNRVRMTSHSRRVALISVAKQLPWQLLQLRTWTVLHQPRMCPPWARTREPFAKVQLQSWVFVHTLAFIPRMSAGMKSVVGQVAKAAETARSSHQVHSRKAALVNACTPMERGGMTNVSGALAKAALVNACTPMERGGMTNV